MNYLDSKYPVGRTVSTQDYGDVTVRKVTGDSGVGLLVYFEDAEGRQHCMRRQDFIEIDTSV